MNRFKKIVSSITLTVMFVTSLGIAGFAQDWGRGRWDRNDDRWDRNDRDRDWNRDDRRNDRWAREQMEKGFRDGDDRGRKDARTNRRRDPNNSSHYRKGNEFYRRGFERGFFRAFDQNCDNDRGRGRWGW
jgi:hypothetical protein